GVVLAGGIALGVVLSSVQDGSSRDLAAYLVGSIVTTTSTGVATTVVWGVAICLVLALLHRPLVASAFDPTGCQAAGLAVPALDVAALLVVMASIAVLVPAVGTILSVSLLVAPAATARLWTDRLRTTFVL